MTQQAWKWRMWICCTYTACVLVVDQPRVLEQPSLIRRPLLSGHHSRPRQRPRHCSGQLHPLSWTVARAAGMLLSCLRQRDPVQHGAQSWASLLNE